jgi:Ribonuclease G/E
MARGWESKSVESQIESAESRKQDRLRQKLSPEQQEKLSQRGLLELSRVRLQHQIQESTNERYRRMLTQALVDVDQKLAELDRPSIPPRKRNSDRSD